MFGHPDETLMFVVLLIVVDRMKKAGIACPSVALLKKHILVMSFIGKDQQPAPKLKDAVLSPRQLQLAYEQCVQVSDLFFMFAKVRARNIVCCDVSTVSMHVYHHTEQPARLQLQHVVC